MSLNPFSINQKSEGLETKVELNGYVNETADFSPVKVTPVMRIALKNVTGLNSVGTRTWCKWMQSLASCNEIWLESCPILFVKAFNQVMGALPANAVVQSFLVPYFSESTGESQEVLYVLGQDYNMKGSYKIKDIKDSNGQSMEVDVVLDVYLSFIKDREQSL